MRYLIKPHSSNEISIKSPHSLWLVIDETGKLIAACMSEQDAQRVVTGLTSYWDLGN